VIIKAIIRENHMKKYIDTGKKDTRSGFGDGLTELGKSNKNVVALCADLIGSLKMDDFKKIILNVSFKLVLLKQI